MLETVEELIPEYFAKSCSVSIHREIIIKENNVEIGRNRVHSRAFLPGNIEELKEYVGENAPIISFCEQIWTPEKIAEQEARSEQ